MTVWAWDDALKRYRDSETGRFLGSERVRDLIGQSITATEGVTDRYASLVSGAVEGQALSPADWNALMRQEIKDEYIRQYLLGRGGVEQMTQADWGSIGGSLTEQYRYLNEFYAEVQTGNLSEAQIAARSRMYIRSGREAYERAVAKNQKELSMDEESWVLGAAEHCDDCIALAAEGWKPIGYFPMPGAGLTACLTNCACHKEYRKAPESESEAETPASAND